jgi:phosphoglycerate dehydrogenase-like enzyme
MFLMLMFAKRFAATQETVGAERLCVPVTSELAGQTLGLVGFGASARELATRAHAFAMRILAYDVEPVAPEEQRARGVVCDSDTGALDRILAQADYLSVHVPLTSATRHLVNRRALRLMKPTAVIINVARGEVIDEVALAEALGEGRLYGAGLDVFATEPLPAADPLRRLANVIATPHVAGVTGGTALRRAHAALENIARVERGLEPLFAIHAADAEMGPQSRARP